LVLDMPTSLAARRGELRAYPEAGRCSRSFGRCSNGGAPANSPENQAHFRVAAGERFALPRAERASCAEKEIGHDA
jgi:hypothetical protein